MKIHSALLLVLGFTALGAQGCGRPADGDAPKSPKPAQAALPTDPMPAPPPAPVQPSASEALDAFSATVKTSTYDNRALLDSSLPALLKRVDDQVTAWKGAGLKTTLEADERLTRAKTNATQK